MILARFESGVLVARTDGAGQAGVVGAVVVVPQRLATANAVGENFQLFARAGRGLRGLKTFVIFRGEILVMALLEDGLEDVFECWIGHDGFNS